MGLETIVASSLVPAAKFFKLVERERQRISDQFFEPELAKRGLSTAAIESMDRAGLQAALGRIDEGLQNIEQFGDVRLKIDTENLRLVPVAPTDEAQFVLDAEPVLLSRKQLVLERLGTLSDSKSISSLRDAVAQVDDERVRAELEGQLEALKEQKDLIDAAQSVATEREQRTREDAEQVSAALEKVEILERRSAVWRSFLGRESAATIIGAVLLVLLAIALIAGMFLGTDVPEIVSSAFLLILGYFFGQNKQERQIAQSPAPLARAGR